MKTLLTCLLLASLSAFAQDGVTVRSRNGNATNLNIKGITLAQQIVATNYSGSGSGLTNLTIGVGQTLYVDSTYGNDSGGVRGQFGKPFLTLAAANSAAQTGDTIFIRPGSNWVAAPVPIKAGTTVRGEGKRSLLNATFTTHPMLIVTNSNIEITSLLLQSLGDGLGVRQTGANMALATNIVLRDLVIHAAEYPVAWGNAVGDGGLSGATAHNLQADLWNCSLFATRTGITMGARLELSASSVIRFFNCEVEAGVDAIQITRGTAFIHGGTWEVFDTNNAAAAITSAVEATINVFGGRARAPTYNGTGGGWDLSAAGGTIVECATDYRGWTPVVYGGSPIQHCAKDLEAISLTVQSNIISATGFIGDGSGLTNLIGGDSDPRFTSGANTITAGSNFFAVVNAAGAARLMVDSVADGYPGLELYEAGARKWIAYNNPADSWVIEDDGGSERLTVTTGGNVGIGTTGPDSKLEVAGDIRAGVAGQIGFRYSEGDDGIYNYITANGGNPLTLFGGLWTGVGSTEAIRFQSQGGVAMSILNDGSVGIGTATPEETLDVDGNGQVSGYVISDLGFFGRGPDDSFWLKLTNATHGPMLHVRRTNDGFSASPTALVESIAPVLQASTVTGVDEPLTNLYTAFKFVATGAHTMRSMAFPLKGSGVIENPARTLVGELYTDSAGSPGTILAPGSSIVYGQVNDLAASAYWYAHSDATYDLVGGTTYWLVCRQVVAPVGGQVLINTSATGTGMFAWSTNGSTWTVQNNKTAAWRIYGRSEYALMGDSDGKYGVFGGAETGRGVQGSSQHGHGVSGYSGSSYAVYGTSAYNVAVAGVSVHAAGLYGRSQNSHAILAEVNSSTTNTVLPIITTYRTATGGAAGNGIGTSTENYLENSAGVDLIASRFATTLTDVTDGSEDSKFSLFLRNNSVEREALAIGTNGVSFVGIITGDGSGLTNLIGANGGGTNRYYEAGEAFHWVEVGGTNGDPYGIKGASSSATVSSWSISHGGNVLTDGNITAAGSLNITSGAQLGSTLTVADTLTVGAGVNGDGGGLKHGRVTTGSIAGLASAAVTLTWTTPFANANYTVTCDVVEADATVTTLRKHHIESQTASAVVVRVINDHTTDAKTGVLNVIAIHD